MAEQQKAALSGPEAERLWLHYFNRTLLDAGYISPQVYSQIRAAVERRPGQGNVANHAGGIAPPPVGIVK